MSTRVEHYRSDILTLANQLTMLRILFVPIFIILLVYSEVGWALTVFMAAGITDVLDGLIARRFGQKTTIGACLDPIADKLLMTASVLILSFAPMGFANQIPRWLMILVISRDVFIFSFALVFVLISGFRSFPPSVYGKASTALQVFTIFSVLYCNWRGVAVPQLLILYIMTGIVTTVSGLHYLTTKFSVPR